MNQPFDAAAAKYDATFTKTFTGNGQRKLVWKWLDKTLKNHPNKSLKILEINCGTGEDALHLAQLGHMVLATDISPKMIEEAQKKLADTSLSNLSFEVLDINQLEQVDDKFDLVFSNFGGLNCLSPDQLKKVGEKVTNILNPKGFFVAVIMSRKCSWEQLYFLAKRDSAQRKRRLRKESLEIIVDGTIVHTWFYSPTECVDLFKDTLHHKVTKPIGIGYPPSYLNSLVERYSMLKGFALLTEDLFGNTSRLSNRADHFLITFTKE